MTGENIIGTLVADHIHPADVLPYLQRLERTFDKGLEFCTFRLQDKLWLAKMEKISSHRIKITEYYIEGMGINEVLWVL